MNSEKMIAVLCAPVLVFCSLTSQADVVSLTASDTGFVTEAGGASKFDGLVSPATFNYSTGWEVICLTGGLCPPVGPFGYGEKKNYFVFDVSSVTDPVIGASLIIDVPVDGYDSPDASETFIVSGTGVPIEDIVKLTEPSSPSEITGAHIGTAATVFSGLTDEFDISGTAFGAYDLSESDEGGPVEILLDPSVVGYIDTSIGAGGALIFGGKVTTLTMSPSGPAEEIFSFSDSVSPTVTLELITAPVPVPAAVWLFGSGLLAMITFARRKI